MRACLTVILIGLLNFSCVGNGDMLFEFSPIRNLDWSLEQGEAYTLKYRMVVFDGEMDVESAEKYWQEFAGGKRILIYTRNGEGYVHENIDASVAALEKICDAENIATDVSDQPAVFTPSNLAQYDAIVFCNTNNEGFDTEDQKKAFQDFIRNGKGFAAIHSANATERQWPWYWALVGGKFLRHAPYQEFDLLVTDPDHPSTSPLPLRWTVEDECYYSFQLNPDIHVLLSADMTTVEDEHKDEYPGETFGQQFPLCWCHHFEGGRQWYTALGHNPEFYSDPTFIAHLRGGILWILGSDH